jgi:hypothetical protein
MKWNFCPNCGHKLEEGWKHCAECGTGIGEIITAPPVFVPMPYPVPAVHPYPWYPWYPSPSIQPVIIGTGITGDPFPGSTLICGDPPPNGPTGGISVTLGNVSCVVQ